MYRAAVIGCGKIASQFDDPPKSEGVHTHAGAYAACPSTELVAVCDSDGARVTRCGERWQVTACYTDLNRLLVEQHPDIVSICTPDETHADVLQTVLQSPGVKAVLAEKPLALTVTEARRLCALAQAQDIVLAVNYTRRFAPSHIALKEWIEAGGLGQLQVVNGYYVKGLLHNGTHWLDLARFLVGDVEQVRGNDRMREVSPDPTLDIELRFRNGAGGYLCGLDTRQFTLFEMDLVGTIGRACLGDSGYHLEVFSTQDSARYQGYRELARVGSSLRGGLENALLYAVTDVVRCLTEGGQPRCSGRDGVAALEIATAARAAAADGHWNRVEA